MQALTLSLIQGDTRWLDGAANREYYGALARGLPRSDLIVLPETFASGFTNDVTRVSETMEGASVAWMRALAAERGAVITGSLVIAENGQHYNRLIWMRPDGSFEHYDKRHLFRMAREHEHFSGGVRRPIVDLCGWRILLQVCYDLRFPAWARNRRNEDAAGGMDYDLLLYVANWPAARRGPWRTLLRARAIENLSYCVGVNRAGTDGNGFPYAGDSAVIDFLGEPLVELDTAAQTTTLTLAPQLLLTHRQRFPAWMDADAFSIEV